MVTNASKHNITFTGLSKNMVSFDSQEKAGSGWDYNDMNLTYNAVFDPDSGNEVFYNGIGRVTTFTNQSKN
jgi:hypothetical protein